MRRAIVVLSTLAAACGGILELKDLHLVAGSDGGASDGAAPTDASADASSASCLAAGGPVDAGPRAVTVLAGSLHGPRGLAISGDTVFVAEPGDDANQNVDFYNCGRVESVAIDGGAPVPQSTGEPAAWDIAVQGGAAFFTRNFLFDGTEGGNVRKKVIDGTSTHSTAFTISGASFATRTLIHGSRLYWLQAGTNAPGVAAEAAAIVSCDLTGCGAAPVPELTFANGDEGYDFTIAGDLLTVAVRGGNAVRQCTVGSCAATLHTIAAQQNAPSHVTSDGTFVYWTNEGYDNATGALMKAPNDGSCTVTLAANLEHPQAIATDGVNVYVLAVGTAPAYDDGALLRCSVDGCGGAPSKLATNLQEPREVILDATRAYFTTFGARGQTCANMNGALSAVLK